MRHKATNKTAFSSPRPPFARPSPIHGDFASWQALGDRELTVSQLVDALGIAKSNVSQHLGIMREKGAAHSTAGTGGHVYYWLSSAKIVMACRLMREVLLEQLESAGELSRFEQARQRSLPRERRWTMNEDNPQKTLIILNDSPYGSERSYNGLRLAGALARNE